MVFKTLWKLSIPVLALMLVAACNNSQDTKENMKPQEKSTNVEMNTKEPASKEVTPEEKPTNGDTNSEEPTDGKTDSEESTNQ
jgi:stringent starvation protein B